MKDSGIKNITIMGWPLAWKTIIFMALLHLSGCAYEDRQHLGVYYFAGLSRLESVAEYTDGYADMYINGDFVKRFNSSGVTPIYKFLTQEPNIVLVKSHFAEAYQITIVRRAKPKAEDTFVLQDIMPGKTTFKRHFYSADNPDWPVLDTLMQENKAEHENEIESIVEDVFEMLTSANASLLVKTVLEGEVVRGQIARFRRGEDMWRRVLSRSASFSRPRQLNYIHGPSLVFVYSGEKGSEAWKKTLLFENEDSNVIDLPGLHFGRIQGRWIVW